MESNETGEMNGNASAAVEEKATTAIKEEQKTETLQSEPKEAEKTVEMKPEEAIQPVESTIPEVVHTVDDIYDFDDISGKDIDFNCWWIDIEKEIGEIDLEDVDLDDLGDIDKEILSEL